MTATVPPQAPGETGNALIDNAVKAATADFTAVAHVPDVSRDPTEDADSEAVRAPQSHPTTTMAEHQRQQEIEEQRKREDAEAKRRQKEFDRNKRDALSSMKRIAEGELGLKGADAGILGLKDIGDTGTGSLELKKMFQASS